MARDNPGGDARAPSELPALAWRDALRRALCRASEDGLLTEAGGIAFFAVFALLAGLVAFASVAGLLGDAAALGRRVRDVGDILPAGVPEILDQLLANAAPGRVAASLATALWGAIAAAQALLRGLNLAYGERESRGALRLAGSSLAVALCGGLFALLALGAFLALPTAVGSALLLVLRWPALLAVAIAGLAVLYRYGPCRAEPRWRWVTWGSAFAALAWVLSSAAFSWFARGLGGYGAAYGPLAAVVAFMTWAWLSATALLFGAVLNAETERQTARDATSKPQQPMGGRVPQGRYFKAGRS